MCQWSHKMFSVLYFIVLNHHNEVLRCSVIVNVVSNLSYRYPVLLVTIYILWSSHFCAVSMCE